MAPKTKTLAEKDINAAILRAELNEYSVADLKKICAALKKSGDLSLDNQCGKSGLKKADIIKALAIGKKGTSPKKEKKRLKTPSPQKKSPPKPKSKGKKKKSVSPQKSPPKPKSKTKAKLLNLENINFKDLNQYTVKQLKEICVHLGKCSDEDLKKIKLKGDFVKKIEGKKKSPAKSPKKSPTKKKVSISPKRKSPTKKKAATKKKKVSTSPKKEKSELEKLLRSCVDSKCKDKKEFCDTTKGKCEKPLKSGLLPVAYRKKIQKGGFKYDENKGVFGTDDAIERYTKLEQELMKGLGKEMSPQKKKVKPPSPKKPPSPRKSPSPKKPPSPRKSPSPKPVSPKKPSPRKTPPKKTPPKKSPSPKKEKGKVGSPGFKHTLSKEEEKKIIEDFEQCLEQVLAQQKK